MSGFFAPHYALAAHTATVTVDPILVKGSVATAYTFTITKTGGNDIVYVKVENSNFTNYSSVSCPVGWTSDNGGGTYARCTWPFEGDKISTSGIISFTATAPLPAVDTNYAWTVTTKDDVGGTVINTTDAVTRVDVTAPTVLSITTKDTDSDGKVETATIVFSEPVNDLSFLASNFTIGGVGAIEINTGAPNDNTFNIVIADGIEGTEAKDVTYTQGTGADLVGNLLTNVLSGTVTEIDGAAPVFVSARTTSPTTIAVTFSEDLNGSTVTNADFSVTGYTLSTPDASELNGVVTLTTATSFGTGETPAVTYNTTVSNGVEDLAGNQAPAAGPITPTDGVSPIIASARTITTTQIEVTFSEAMSAVLSTDFLVSGNSVANIALVGEDNTKAIITLGTEISTGDTPNVSTIETPTGTKDSAENLIVGGLLLTPQDKILPVVLNATASPDPAKAGDVTITVIFSESMNTAALPTVQITGITGSPITVTQSSYTNNTWTGTFVLVDNNEEKTATIFVAGAVDLNGNIMEENANAGTFGVDTIEPLAPNVTLPAIVNIANVGSVSLNITGETGTIYNYAIEDATPGFPISGSGTLTGGSVTLSVNLSSLDDGDIAATVTLTDSAGNISSAGTDTATKDTLIPTITSITSNAIEAGTLKVGNTITFTLTPSATEPGASVVGSYNSVPLTWSTADAGVTYTATYTVAEGNTDQTSTLQITGVVITDTAGNPSVAGNGTDVQKTIDANRPGAPTVTLLDPINNTNETAVTITGTGEANATINYSIDDSIPGSPVTGTGTVGGGGSINVTGIDVSTLIDGTLTGSVTLTDAAGNVSNPGTDTATKDTAAPNVPVVNLPEFINIANATSVSFTITGESNTAYEYTISDGTNSVPGTGALTGGSITLSVDLSGLNDGAIIATVTLTDAAGNESTEGTDTATKDTEAPTATETTPVVTPTKNNTPDVLITVENTVGWVIKNSSDTLISGTGTGVAQTVTLPTLTDDTYNLTLIATDTAGNQTIISLTTFLVDATNPTVNAGPDAIKNALFTQDATASDGGSGIATYTWTKESGSGTITFGTANAEDTTVSASSDGTYVVRLTVTDNAGNSAYDEFGLIWDTTAPTITVKSPSENAVGIDPNTNITITFIEDMNATTINSTNITLKKGADTVLTSVTYNAATKVATINPTPTLNNNSKYTITLTDVTDLAGNALSQAPWDFTTAGSYSIALTKGWNLISLPVVPNSTAIATVLQGISSNIQTVWAYDALTDHWSVYHPDGIGTSDLTSMTAGYGYWINYLSDSSTNLVGTGNLILEGNNTPPSRKLKEGWNLIGYYQKPNTVNVSANNALKNNLTNYWTILMGYNNTNKEITPLTGTDLLHPGDGFWVWLNADRAYTMGDSD